MKISGAQLVGLAGMVGLALFTSWLERAVRDDTRPPSLRRHDPDYIVDNFTVTSYDRSGAPESTLAASRMVHYPDDDTTDLIAPRMVQTRPNEPRITFQANRGVMSADGSEVFFFGDAQFVRDARGEIARTEVQTEFLHAMRDRGLVRTDRYVDVREEDRRLSGRGMDYDNETRRLVLHHEVQGVYPPKKAAP